MQSRPSSPALDFATAPGFVINGLKREELIASNSMILHELFFASLGEESAPEGELREALIRDFGNIDRWRAEFSAMGNGPHDDARRRLPDPRARYVRALLSHGLRREGSGLCRRLHGGDKLAERGTRLWRAQVVMVSLASASSVIKT